jgi:hypothetical protein
MAELGFELYFFKEIERFPNFFKEIERFPNFFGFFYVSYSSQLLCRRTLESSPGLLRLWH